MTYRGVAIQTPLFERIPNALANRPILQLRVQILHAFVRIVEELPGRPLVISFCNENIQSIDGLMRWRTSTLIFGWKSRMALAHAWRSTSCLDLGGVVAD